MGSNGNGKGIRGYVKCLLSALVIVMFYGATSVASISSDAIAGSSDAGPFDKFLSGEVTATRESILQINNKDYIVLEDATVTDEKNKAMSLKDLLRGTQVMFHLKQGRIDQIIILFPS